MKSNKKQVPQFDNEYAAGSALGRVSLAESWDFHIGPANFSIAAGAGILESEFFSGALSPLKPVLIGLGVPLIHMYYLVLPDMTIGTNFQDSDQFKRLAYHEIAHASHYTHVDNEYWMRIILGEIANDGWGDADGVEAAIISLTESWADHVSLAYAHREYGINNSITDFSYEELSERWVSVSPNHVPIGVHHDLIDDVVDPTFRVIDNVSGFTRSQLFSSLRATSIAEYQTQIIDNYLNTTSNTQGAVNALFNSY